jgi:formyl-CoA transferase
MIDVALYESVFNMMESLLPEYAVFGEIRQPAGSSLPGIAPSNAYRCQDNKYVLIAGNGDSIFKRLMGVIGRPDLAEAPELANNAGRVKHVVMLDDAISAWTGRHPLDVVLARLNDGQIPAGKIYDVADIATDPHYQARGMILDGALPDGTPVKLPGIVPKLSETPGEVRSAAPALGQDTDEVLAGLGIGEAQRTDWRARGII